MLTVDVRLADSGKSIVPSAVACSARLEGRNLAGTDFLRRGQGICTWRIPARTSGDTLQAAARVSYQGASVTKSVTLDVAGALRELKIFRPTFAPSRPEAGVVFQAAFTVGWELENGSHEPIKAKQTTVTCKATAGTVLKAIKSKVVPSGVVCGWLLPTSVAGRLLTLVVTVRSAGAKATKSVHLRVH